jgi:hypothetical protein
MKDSQDTNCRFHGANLRPHVCKDCRMLTKPAPKETLLQLDERDKGRLERFEWMDHLGRVRVGFRLAKGPIERPDFVNQPWGQTWD